MDPAETTPAMLRAACRHGSFTRPTSGFAAGFVQANLMIVPREFAFDFLLFCQRNPKPCPLVEVLEAGSFEPRCAPGADIRTDLPGYRIYRDGVLAEETNSISEFWTEDLVSFLIGCSFSFEEALMREGIRLRHVENQKNVAMYRTNIPCASAGRMHGNMVVSMRPIRSAEVARAVEISARFPEVHGAPVHVGAPAEIGITNIDNPDFGDASEILPGELPVFWACGVTPQVVAQASRLPFCMTHAPGKMFVTDQASRK